MSTLIEDQHQQVLHSEEDLAFYFDSHAKAESKRKIGMEAEFLGVNAQTGKALSYDGANGIHEVLKLLVRDFHYQPLLEQGHIIGLTKGDWIIALEPGGQIELSAPPVQNIFDIESQLQIFLSHLHHVQSKMPSVRWLAAGIQPFSSLEEITWVPKKRYKILSQYLGVHGALSHHMMKRTATNQFNFDYSSEADAMEKLRTALGITSIVSAMFAHSSFSDGKPNGYQSYRLEIWNQTDPARTGLISSFLEPGKKFKDYLDYVLKIPVIFIVRRGEWIAVKNLNFREYIQQGYQGIKATLGDFELHLSATFPEVRIKQYIEVRGLDGQSTDLIAAAGAFWKGILYDKEALQKAWNLVSFAGMEERLKLHRDVPIQGLKALLGNKPILPLAAELVQISSQGLKRQQMAGTQSEADFLLRIQEKILKPQKSPGQSLVEHWQTDLDQDPQKLLHFLSL